MTEEMWVLVIGQVVTFLAALTAYLQSRTNGKKADAIQSTATDIHTATVDTGPTLPPAQ